jgi:hypothetical protein
MKTLRFSQHALNQMRLRGAPREEVMEVVEAMPWQPAKRGKYQSRKTFAFGRPSDKRTDLPLQNGSCYLCR